MHGVLGGGKDSNSSCITCGGDQTHLSPSAGRIFAAIAVLLAELLVRDQFDDLVQAQVPWEVLLLVFHLLDEPGSIIFVYRLVPDHPALAAIESPLPTQPPIKTTGCGDCCGIIGVVV